MESKATSVAREVVGDAEDLAGDALGDPEMRLYGKAKALCGKSPFDAGRGRGNRRSDRRVVVRQAEMRLLHTRRTKLRATKCDAPNERTRVCTVPKRLQFRARRL